MTDLDNALVPVSLDLINSFGKDGTFTVKDSEAYDPSTGVVSVTTSTVVIKMSPPTPYERRYINGDLVKAGDTEVLIAASGLTFTPDEGQKVEFDSETWNVVSVGRLYSGESIAVYRLQLRR